MADGAGQAAHAHAHVYEDTNMNMNTIWYVPTEQERRAAGLKGIHLETNSFQFEAVVSNLSTVVEVAGGTRGVRFENLRVQHSEWSCSGIEPRRQCGIPADEFGSGAFLVTGGATADIVLLNSTIAHTGHYAVVVEAAGSVTVSGSNLTDMGGGGIRTAYDAGAHTFTNNRILKGGRVFEGAMGVQLQSSLGHNLISDNEVGFMYESGIHISSKGNSTRVLNNYVHHIGQRRLSDMGGILTSYHTPNVLVQGNVVRDVTPFHYGGDGLYSDEGSSGVTYDRNEVYNTRTGYHMHFGYDTVLSNNLFNLTDVGGGGLARGGGDGGVYTNPEDNHPLNFVFVNNTMILNNGGGAMFARDLHADRLKNCTFDHNVYVDMCTHGPAPGPSPVPKRCCWDRQACTSSLQCDQGGEGCVVSGTMTKKYGRVTCQIPKGGEKARMRLTMTYNYEAETNTKSHVPSQRAPGGCAFLFPGGVSFEEWQATGQDLHSRVIGHV